LVNVLFLCLNLFSLIQINNSSENKASRLILSQQLLAEGKLRMKKLIFSSQNANLKNGMVSNISEISLIGSKVFHILRIQFFTYVCYS